MSKMIWKDYTTTYNGKALRADIWLDEDTVLQCELHYSDYRPEGTKYCTYAEAKELGHEITLHVGKMRRDGVAFSGGIGKFEKQADTRTNRKTIKGLWDYSENITKEHCKDIGTPQHTNASTVDEILRAQI